MSDQVKVKGRALTPDEKIQAMSHIEAEAMRKWAKSKGIKGGDVNDYLRIERHKLGELAYKLGFSAADKKLLKSRPGWFQTESHIKFLVWDGQRKDRTYMPMAERRPLPYNAVNSGWGSESNKDELTFGEGHPVSVRTIELNALEKEFMDTRRKLQEELRLVFNGRVTGTAVIKRWPEIVKVYPAIKELAKETKQQLVIMTSGLNAALGYAS